ncbi:MAG: HAD family hydrolase [Chloroflexi bacterium]|nr:HAD family hydrolase [Chloroflexota bacterium]
MSGGRAVFLDRDGVLVKEVLLDGSPFVPLTVSDFRLVPEAAAQVQRLRDAGLTCIVFTNQPEVARGLLATDTLEAMHRELRATVPVDDVYVCPHVDADACPCRKPRTGMLTSAAERWDVCLEQSFVIGDRWRDIEAGRAVGCYTILIDRPYSACETADVSVPTLVDAVNAIMARLERVQP